MLLGGLREEECAADILGGIDVAIYDGSGDCAQSVRGLGYLPR